MAFVSNKESLSGEASAFHAGRFQIHPQNQVPVQTCSSGEAEEFSPRKFWRECNIFRINNGSREDSRCVLLTDEQMSHRCVLQLLLKPPTPSQLIQMFCQPPTADVATAKMKKNISVLFVFILIRQLYGNLPGQV